MKDTDPRGIAAGTLDRTGEAVEDAFKQYAEVCGADKGILDMLLKGDWKALVSFFKGESPEQEAFEEVLQKIGEMVEANDQIDWQEMACHLKPDERKFYLFYMGQLTQLIDMIISDLEGKAKSIPEELRGLRATLDIQMPQLIRIFRWVPYSPDFLRKRNEDLMSGFAHAFAGADVIKKIDAGSEQNAGMIKRGDWIPLGFHRDYTCLAPIFEEELSREWMKNDDHPDRHYQHSLERLSIEVKEIKNYLDHQHPKSPFSLFMGMELAMFHYHETGNVEELDEANVEELDEANVEELNEAIEAVHYFLEKCGKEEVDWRFIGFTTTNPNLGIYTQITSAIILCEGIVYAYILKERSFGMGDDQEYLNLLAGTVAQPYSPLRY